MRILICGDRRWTDHNMIKLVLLKYPLDSIIIEGECRGADMIAKEEALKLGMTVEPYTAYWGKYGRAAGPIRNKRMLVMGKPDLVIAFHNNIAKSKGTANMLIQAKARNIPIMVYP